jgi:hypothetical protein
MVDDPQKMLSELARLGARPPRRAAKHGGSQPSITDVPPAETNAASRPAAVWTREHQGVAVGMAYRGLAMCGAARDEQ